MRPTRSITVVQHENARFDSSKPETTENHQYVYLAVSAVNIVTPLKVYLDPKHVQMLIDDGVEVEITLPK